MPSSTPQTPNTRRPDWDETWITVAKTVAQRSLCTRDKVGAVVVSKQNRLLETGYNGPPGGFVTNDKSCLHWCSRALNAERKVAHQYLGAVGLPEAPPLQKDYFDCPSLHAEANALLRGDRFAREGGTIYTTSHVCMGCAKLIANSGLASVYVDSSITDPVWRNPVAVYEFLDRCGIAIYVA